MSTEANVRVRPKETEHEINEQGYFVRQKNHFNTPFGEGEGKLPVEAGRYRLIWGQGLPLVEPCLNRQRAARSGGGHQH